MSNAQSAEEIAKKIHGNIMVPHLHRNEVILVTRALLDAIEALESIQNEYGDPHAEDNVTTTAREALAKIRGEKP